MVPALNPPVDMGSFFGYTHIRPIVAILRNLQPVLTGDFQGEGPTRYCPEGVVGPYLGVACGGLLPLTRIYVTHTHTYG